MPDMNHRHTPPVGSKKYSVGFRVIGDPLLADPSLSPTDKVVLMALQKGGWRDHRCWTSIETISEACGIPERTVQRSLARLKRHGDQALITMEKDANPANKTGRVISLLWMDDPNLHPHECVEGDNATPTHAKMAPQARQNGVPPHAKMAPELTESLNPNSLTPPSPPAATASSSAVGSSGGASVGRNVTPTGRGEGAGGGADDVPEQSTPLDDESRRLRDTAFECLDTLAKLPPDLPPKDNRLGATANAFAEAMTRLFGDPQSKGYYAGLARGVVRRDHAPGDIKTVADATLDRIHFKPDPLRNIAGFFVRTLQKIEANREHAAIEAEAGQPAARSRTFYGPYDGETWDEAP